MNLYIDQYVKYGSYTFRIDFFFFLNLSLFQMRGIVKMIIAHDEEYYRRRVPEPDLGPLRNFLRFVWNGETKTLLGRSGTEWSR